MSKTKRTKKQILSEIDDCFNEIGYLENVKIPNLVKELKEFKVTLKDVNDHELDQYF